jgi:hypothetical protein
VGGKRKDKQKQSKENNLLSMLEVVHCLFFNNGLRSELGGPMKSFFRLQRFDDAIPRFWLKPTDLLKDLMLKISNGPHIIESPHDVKLEIKLSPNLCHSLECYFSQIFGPRLFGPKRCVS